MSSSQIVVYTTIAIVYTRVDIESDGTMSRTWKAVADGAWAQLHLFLEMERDPASPTSPRHQRQLVRHFRLVAWVLETGKVIVNDVLCATCRWTPVEELLWQFTNAEGDCYEFQFRTVEQAQECADVIGNVLSNVDEIRRLVKRMYQVQSTTRDFLVLLYDIGFFKLDGHRRSTMIESAHAAVASLNQADPDWRRSRPFYPKEQLTTTELSHEASLPPCSSASAEDIAEETTIIMRSIAKRSSDHHLLAQFTEVQRATLAATSAAIENTEADESEEEEEEEEEEEGSIENQSVAREHEEPSRTTETVPGSSRQNASVSRIVPSDVNISLPFKTRQELHVTYNTDLARYEGLPWVWRRLNIQFGLPLEAVPKRPVNGYEANIPAVLYMLKESLLANDGLKVEGIFRIGPDKDKCLVVKGMINDGTFVGTSDVHILANLIKVWFRDLPVSLFNVVPQKHIYKICELKDPSAVMASLSVFPKLHRSALLWLLDLMADVVHHEPQNKMSARNMAIVISPNLFSIESDNPMYALTMSQKVAEYTLILLNARIQQRQRE